MKLFESVTAGAQCWGHVCMRVPCGYAVCVYGYVYMYVYAHTLVGFFLNWGGGGRDGTTAYKVCRKSWLRS